MAIEVTYDRKICIHSGNCVKTLPQVFRVQDGKFVIDPAAAEEAKVRATVAACPSHALKIAG
ncbi:MAG TPA: (4Fe-4S)-binding protein [Candidatus Binataceae bacterium]|nr:(4Fe-4S)-binding protein [Candidatus Binataceae bacterium]